MPDIDFDLVHELLESKNRIAIMAALASGDEYDFPALKSELGLTDGNLSSHMARLAEAGLVAVRKSGAGKASRTVYAITRCGTAAWGDYIDFLRAVIARAR